MINLKISIKKKYVVALSGGPDSVYLLDNLIKKIDNKKIIACHVNYNFRPDSIIDENICQEYCKKNNIKLIVKNIYEDYNNFQKNFEKWAREIRYNFFKDVIEEYKFDEVLIAHNMNDDIETLLMQIEKKTLPIYWGIKKTTEIFGVKIRRQIIDVKKSEILNYLKLNSIHYAVDSTNLNQKYTRNKIRAQLNENQFAHLLNIKKQLNQKLAKQNISIKRKITHNFININNFSDDEEYNLRLLFLFIKTHTNSKEMYSRKKKTIKELLKQINSKKAFLKIEIADIIIIKDREWIYVYNNNQLKIINKKIKYLSDQEKVYFQGTDFSKYNKNLYVTNDWINLKNKVLYNGIILKEMYKKYKWSYMKRFFEPIIYEKYNKNIINKLF